MLNKEILLLKHAPTGMIYEITVGGSGAKGSGYGYYGNFGSCRKLSPKCPDLRELRTYYTESHLGSKRWHTSSNLLGTFTRLDTGRSITITGGFNFSDPYDYFLGTEVGKKIKVKYEPL